MSSETPVTNTAGLGLPPLPSGWQVKRLRFIATVQTGMAKGKDLAGEDTVEVPYLRVANVQDGYLDLTDVATMPVPVRDLDRYRLQPGDVLMNEGGDFDKLGRGHVWHGQIEPCIHQNHVFAVRPHGVSPEWLNAYTGSAPAQFYFMGRAKQSTNLASISSSNLMELPVVVPTDDERDALLAFLDSETARIGALIEKKLRFIELLHEKRQRLVTQIVTTGIRSGTLLKESGVCWFKQIPAHRCVKRLRHVTQSVKAGPFGSSLTKEVYVSSGTRVYGQEQVISGDFALGDYYIDDSLAGELSQYRVRPGDVLISCVGTFGKIAVVPISAEPGVINPRLIRLRLNSLVDPCYLAEILRSSIVFEQFQLWSRGGTLDVINVGTLNSIFLPIPPPEEQISLLEQIRVRSAKLDALVYQTERSIELLRERRAALITAAVTGQIDLHEAT